MYVPRRFIKSLKMSSSNTMIVTIYLQKYTAKILSLNVNNETNSLSSYELRSLFEISNKLLVLLKGLDKELSNGVIVLMRTTICHH